MKKYCFAILVLVVAATGIATAATIPMVDAVALTGGATFTNMPANIASSNAYWNNPSGDGPQMNIGYLLTGTGGFTGDTNYDPLQYLSQNNGVGQPDASTDISVVQGSGATDVSLIGSYTLDKTLTFGYYNESDPDVLYPLGDGGVLSGIPQGGDIGFYLTRSCYGDLITGCVNGYTTWYSDSVLDTTDVGHQHFVIFDSPIAGTFYVGVEDWGLAAGLGLEGLGDYQDFVYEVSSLPASVSTPEPVTFSLVAVGLLGFGLFRRHSRKKN